MMRRRATNHVDLRCVPRLIWSTALAVTTLTGCSSGFLPGEATGSPGGPVITSRPAVTASSTAPSASPLAESSAPSRTEPPDVRTPSFRVFKKHVERADKNLESLIKDWERQGGQRDIPGLIALLEPLREWTDREESWLLANQPRPCYANLHEVYRSWVSKYAEAFEIMSTALEPMNEPELYRAVRLMNEAQAGLEAYRQSPGFRSGADLHCGSR